MFDLTKEIELRRDLRKKYAMALAILYITFFAGVFFVAYRILFPSSLLYFSFDNANSLKNSLLFPRINGWDSPEKGIVKTGEKFVFNASPSGFFSKAKISFTLEEGIEIKETRVDMRKSYMAFFLPEGDPLGFKEGALLSSGGKYHIISDGMLREFESLDLVLEMGYSRNAFIQVQEEDLKHNPRGEKINDRRKYPDGSVFLIEDAYYQLRNDELFPFVSERAFFSHFDPQQAILKTNDFLTIHPASEDLLGYADGTLVSFDGSVYILSGMKSHPIINPETFVSMGYDWADVIAVDSEEISIYEKQKIFRSSQMHPDGTLFVDEKSGKHYMVSDLTKRPLESDVIAKTYQKQRPIKASLEDSEKFFSCNLKDENLTKNIYSCTIPINDEMNSFSGNAYEISTAFADNANLQTLHMTFRTSFTLKNFMLSLSNIKNRIMINYNITPQ